MKVMKNKCRLCGLQGRSPSREDGGLCLDCSWAVHFVFSHMNVFAMGQAEVELITKRFAEIQEEYFCKLGRRIDMSIVAVTMMRDFMMFEGFIGEKGVNG